MHRSFIHKGPVITILTQSQQSSHQMQKFLQSMFQTQTIHIPLESQSQSQSQSQSEKEKEDKLNQIFPSSSSSSMSLLKKYQYQFNSSISICESSNTILHFLSIDQQTQNQNQNDTVTTDKHDLMTILAITPGPSSTSANKNHETIYTNYIQPTRDTIYDQILRNQTGNNNDSTSSSSSSSSSMFGIKLALKKYMNYNPISNFDLLLHDLPLLDLSSSSSSLQKTSTSTSVSDNNNDAKSSSFHLREIVLPFYDTTTYPNGQSILQSFSKSKLQRPTIGLYQWTDDNDDNDDIDNDDNKNKENKNIVFRPLPSPSTDMNLPPITFVYQCQSLNDAKEHVIQQQQTQMDNENESENTKIQNQELSFTLTKVGFNGYQNNGQLRIENYLTQNDANNNDNDTVNDNDTSKYSLPSSFEFRYCNANELSSSFAEAQESLLAGSLDDLQNVNVMAEGNGHVQGLGKDQVQGQAHSQVQGNSSMNSGEDIQNGIKVEKTTFSSSSTNNNTNNANDAMNGLGDCWVEFRANMKQPSGFFKKQPNGNNSNNKNNNSSNSSNNSGGSNLFSSSFQNLFGKRRNNGNSSTNTVNGHARSTRVAKAPNIPYE